MALVYQTAGLAASETAGPLDVAAAKVENQTTYTGGDDVAPAPSHDDSTELQPPKAESKALSSDDEQDVPSTDAGSSEEEEIDEAAQAGQTTAESTPEESVSEEACESANLGQDSVPRETRFSMEETALIFDWDDTVLPSTWVQCQGLRLDESSELTAWHREQLAEVAATAAETLRIAKQHGTVVIVTNAERGWVELSCQKFLPTLYPAIEGVKVLSARTTYESSQCSSPLDWKLRAFEAEIRRLFGADTLNSSEKRKNILSLGDSVHEREALLRATAQLPNCVAKSLKFVERPDISQICKQHSLVTNCFERIVHHDGNLDLCIRCA